MKRRQFFGAADGGRGHRRLPMPAIAQIDAQGQLAA